MCRLIDTCNHLFFNLMPPKMMIVILGMHYVIAKDRCLIGHKVFILIITKPEVSLTVLKTSPYM